MPTRPSQDDPKRVKVWERRRRALGARVVQLRTERGLTQVELSAKSGISRNVLIDVEQGRRGLLYERLGDLAKALGVSASDLLEGIR
ncbi:helix-turn-helix transcriptional regulator [Mycolicibacterium peregrinum]|uniref:Helix-turn-helix transcriptional regulator n=1 Tax=Mycolicibacterium porcinum TaxID=39693 RepID=A0AAW5T1R5_9MYCO|nr:MULTISPECIES: helix-turn-helix transcriptional regulator [Mycolicibacterium]MCV7205090.1 helix-turn-helix transcriptional regulator [Mycolicibacterium peregrinum]MCV7388204.1 helix-turn-helix transcriptional regulator [Mycolicibacterium porcinum]ORB43294.1 transcriptional regulator [Mycolicibacterium porcinum]